MKFSGNVRRRHHRCKRFSLLSTSAWKYLFSHHFSYNFSSIAFGSYVFASSLLILFPFFAFPHFIEQSEQAHFNSPPLISEGLGTLHAPKFRTNPTLTSRRYSKQSTGLFYRMLGNNHRKCQTAHSGIVAVAKVSGKPGLWLVIYKNALYICKGRILRIPLFHICCHTYISHIL